MKGRISDTHFEVLERKRAAMHANDKPELARQVARLLYDGAETGSMRHGTAARNLAEAYGRGGDHLQAWQFANEAWRIHERQVQRTRWSPEALCERAASAACAGLMGTLVVLGEKDEAFTSYVGVQALRYAHAALQDFELYNAMQFDGHHPLEARYLPHISVTESVLGEELTGRDLAHQANAVAGTIEKRAISWMDDRHMNMGTLGAVVVSTMAGLGDAEPHLYDTVRQIV